MLSSLKHLGFLIVLVIIGLILTGVILHPVQAAVSSCSADLNTDGQVNILDYSILVTQFFQTRPSLSGDINGDQTINIFDYSILVAQFFTSCTVSGDPSPVPTLLPSPSPTPPPVVSTPLPPSNSDIVGIWGTPEEIAALPTNGAAWSNLVSDSKQSTTNPDFIDQNSKGDLYTLAKAMVYARTPNASCNSKNCGQEVVDTINKLVDTHPVSFNSSQNRWEASSWDWLGVLRGMSGYVAAADLVNLKSLNPSVDAKFRAWLPKARDAWVEGGRGSVVTGQEDRPNNFGAHGASARIAADLYLNDTTDLARAIQVYKGQLGDRSAYKDFKFGDLGWQCDQNNPTPLNPKGCTKNGHNIDGVVPDDQRRCSSSFQWPPCITGYAWEGLQGIIATGEILHRQGYPAFEWSDQALLRTFVWLDQTTFTNGSNYPADGDDQWLVFIIDKRYGTNYQAKWGISPGVGHGKNLGYTDWLLQ